VLQFLYNRRVQVLAATRATSRKPRRATSSSRDHLPKRPLGHCGACTVTNRRLGHVTRLGYCMPLNRGPRKRTGGVHIPANAEEMDPTKHHHTPRGCSSSLVTEGTLVRCWVLKADCGEESYRFPGKLWLKIFAKNHRRETPNLVVARGCERSVDRCAVVAPPCR